jgi:DNA-binding transcriptional ArsR family regulator
MVTISRQLDSVFGALSDATRRAILEELAHGERTVGDLARPFEISRPAISKHLRVLERAGLVQRTPEGRISRCALDAAPLREAADWVDRYRDFWERQLDALARYLEAPKPVDEEESE